MSDDTMVEDVDTLETKEEGKTTRGSRGWKEQVNISMDGALLEQARRLGDMERRRLSNMVELALDLYVKYRFRQLNEDKDGPYRVAGPAPVKAVKAHPVTKSVEADD